MKFGKQTEWKGYTLDELAYHRALTLAKIEVKKERLSEDYSRVKIGNVSMAPNNFSRALGFMSYLDYAIMAFKLVKSLSALFRRKK